jgi:hypothetical protein
MEWLEPWHSIEDDPDQVAAMERELLRELGVGHPLFGLSVRALARRHDCDDVLFAIEDGTGRVAVVHLTWTASVPERPPWPGSAMFASFESWVAEGMRPDSEDYRNEEA